MSEDEQDEDDGEAMDINSSDDETEEGIGPTSGAVEESEDLPTPTAAYAAAKPPHGCLVAAVCHTLLLVR